MPKKTTNLKPRPDLPDMMRWWTKGWRGVFNEELYLKVCEIKSKLR